jgi:TetR/AcrR family transcriptional regulator, transcriptional repressor for nem operon
MATLNPMARVKEFDRDVVLQRALELFWRKGYEATSMADLVAYLGIGRASIYATYGSKHRLYLEALECYLRTRQPNPIELLSQPGPALPAVRALVTQYAAESENDFDQRGCMIVNAAVEMLPGDPVVARRVEASWDGIEVALISTLTRAKAQGELAGDKDPTALGRFLLVLLQGMRVVGKGSPPPGRLADAAAQALSLLD